MGCSSSSAVLQARCRRLLTGIGVKSALDDCQVDLYGAPQDIVLCDDNSSSSSSLGSTSGEASPVADIQHQKALQSFFAHHGTMSSAKQSGETLKALLTDVAGGKPTSNEEVQTILEDAYGVANEGTGVRKAKDMPNHAQVTSDIGHLVLEAGDSVEEAG